MFVGIDWASTEHAVCVLDQTGKYFAVLSVGGFLGIGEKYFAVPWRAFTMDTDNHRFILDVDKQRLENAPGFDKDHWPSMADQSWAMQVHSYYSTRPYWE